LQSFGVSPENLGTEKLEQLQRIANTISDPTQISPEMSRQVLDIFGIRPRGPQKPKVNPKKAKIGRNDACTCGSGLKYKKCCGKLK
jgi:preprotein translocase subunit SecA